MNAGDPDVPFIIMLIIAIIASVVVSKARQWWVKLIGFVFALGSINIILSLVSLSAGWALLVNAVILVLAGAAAFAAKTTANKVMGVILVLIGALLVFPAVGALGLSLPGQAGQALVDAFAEGWGTLVDLVQQIFNAF